MLTTLRYVDWVPGQYQHKRSGRADYLGIRMEPGADAVPREGKRDWRPRVLIRLRMFDMFNTANDDLDRGWPSVRR